MVSDLASMGQDIKRCSLRSAGSLPEGIVHPTYNTNVPCSNERADDDSLYGTPKEEIPPFMVCTNFKNVYSVFPGHRKASLLFRKKN